MNVEGMYYTRSSKGEIAMCKCGNLTPKEYVDYCQEVGYDVVKASYDIIDLIQVGDILYLEESDDIACMFFRDIYLVKNEDNLLNMIDDIKNKKCKLLSIVTKERFGSIEYKIQ